jgi:hypothetical protein
MHTLQPEKGRHGLPDSQTGSFVNMATLVETTKVVKFAKEFIAWRTFITSDEDGEQCDALRLKFQAFFDLQENVIDLKRTKNGIISQHPSSP